MQPTAILNMARGKGKTIPIKVKMPKYLHVIRNLFSCLRILSLNKIFHSRFAQALEHCWNGVLLHHKAQRYGDA